MNENGYCVKGTLEMLKENKIDLEQAEHIVNIWIECTARKFYAEGVLDGLKRNRVSRELSS